MMYEYFKPKINRIQNIQPCSEKQDNRKLDTGDTGSDDTGKKVRLICEKR